MKPLFNEEEYEKAKSSDKLACECYNCQQPFYIEKRFIKYNLKNNFGRYKLCSKKCAKIFQVKLKKVECKNCKIEFEKAPNQIRVTKNNNFCSRSCSITYRNTHKTHGYRRSKLEVWLESQLPLLYPNLEFHFNRKDTINSELDIYIPSLHLAFELNGIFHYEPIYGNKKLDQIQNNDNRKFQACLEHEIELCIIDSSKLKYFKEQNCVKYLEIIRKIIDSKVGGP